MSKKVYVDQNLCMGCTLCTQICPEVFEMDDNGKAKALEAKNAPEKKIQAAMDSCPANAIKWLKE